MPQSLCKSSFAERFTGNKAPHKQQREGSLDDGVVIGPSRFQAMRQFFYGLHALGSPHQKACRGGAQAAHQPNQVLHVHTPLISVAEVATER